MSTVPPLPLRELLAELGFDSDDTHARARAALEEAQLTRPGKVNIDGAKRAAVEELLDGQFHVSCGVAECDEQAGGRVLVHTGTPAACRICGGSSNRRAFRLAEQAFDNAGIRNVVVVGGSPATRDELSQGKPESWELRLIDGTERRNGELARSDLRWADIVLVWGSSELDHKVSELYTRDPAFRHKVVLASRRGVAALLEEAIAHCQKARGREDSSDGDRSTGRQSRPSRSGGRRRRG